MFTRQYEIVIVVVVIVIAVALVILAIVCVRGFGTVFVLGRVVYTATRVSYVYWEIALEKTHGRRYGSYGTAVGSTDITRRRNSSDFPMNHWPPLGNTKYFDP